MVEFFGEITPAVLVVVISVVAQHIKQAKNLSGWKVVAIVLGLSYLLVTPYHLIYTPVTTWNTVYEAIFYPILTCFMAVGFYQVGLKPAIEARQAKAKDE